MMEEEVLDPRLRNRIISLNEEVAPVKIEQNEHEYQYQQDGSDFFVNSNQPDSTGCYDQEDRSRGRVEQDQDFQEESDRAKKLNKPSSNTKSVSGRKTSRNKSKHRTKAKATKSVKTKAPKKLDDPAGLIKSLSSISFTENSRKGKRKVLTLTCSTCSKKFKNRRLLKHHEKVVHTHEPVHCDQCCKSFKNMELLKIHNRRNHIPKSASYEARLINDRSRKQATRNSTPSLLRCLMCNIDFPYRAALKNHEETEHNSLETLTCPTCKKDFTHIEAVKYHIRRVHLTAATSNQTLTCDICQMVFKSSQTLKGHLKKVHYEPAARETSESSLIQLSPNFLTCSICKVEFQTISSLNQHVRTHEPDDGARHQCALCSSNFRLEEQLIEHMQSVHQREECFICTDCGEGFSNRLNFIQHYKTHVKETIWACRWCDKLFRSQKYQLKHERKMHGKSGTGTYPCSECVASALESPAILENHIKNNHPEKYKSNQKIKPRKESNKKRQENNSSLVPSLTKSDQNQDELQLRFSQGSNHEPAESTTTARTGNHEINSFEMPNFEFSQSAVTTANTSSSVSAPAPQDDNENDDWFHFDAPADYSPDSPPSTPIACENNDMKPSINIVSVYHVSPTIERPNNREVEEREGEGTWTRNYVESTMDMEYLRRCPKLGLRTSVDVKRFKALPFRKGNLYCEICHLNFLYPNSLGLHLKRRHGMEYTPKNTTKEVKEALKRLRADNSVNGGKLIKKSLQKKTVTTSKSNPLENQAPEAEQSTPEPETRIQTPESTPESGSSGTLISTSTTEPAPDIFACELCDKSYDSKRKLADHQRMTHGDMPQTCYICKTVLANSQYLGRHMRWVHSHNPVECDICGNEYGSKLKLGMHKRRVHRAVTHTCTICRTDHKTKGSLRLHMRMKHEDDGSRFMCDKCTKTFKRKESFRRHEEEAHAPTDINFSCETCGRTFKRAKSLHNHKLNHVEEENFPCMFCSAKFNTRKKKAVHENKYHGKDDGYPCKICNQVYENARALEKHFLYQHSAADLQTLYYEPAKLVKADIRLPYCQSQSYKHLDTNFEPIDPSPRPSNFQRSKGSWKDLPEEEKKARFKIYYHNPKSCLHCGIICANRHEIYKHIAEVHPEHATIRCDKCNLGFTISKYLYVHNTEVHGAPRPLVCPFCTESFFAHDVYRYHLNHYHGGWKSCDICGIRTKTVAELQRHKDMNHVGHRAQAAN